MKAYLKAGHAFLVTILAKDNWKTKIKFIYTQINC